MHDNELEWTDEAQEKDTARPRFYLHPVKDEAESTKQGRPIFHDREYVEIHTPGDKTNIPVKPVTDEHRRRWPKHYAQFKSGMEEQTVGTPLKEWPAVTRSQVEELAFYKVRTVEDLANLSDSNIQNVGPIRALREKAKDYIAAGKKGAPALKLRAELEKRDNEIEVLKRQVAEQAADLKKMHEARK